MSETNRAVYIKNLQPENRQISRSGYFKPDNHKQVGRSDDFNDVLRTKLKVSGHAQTRLQSRNIHLGEADWSRVVKGIDMAASKGAKDSLVMIDDVALVVSVKNRTVITAVDSAQLKDNVFTNIDSAVIV